MELHMIPTRYEHRVPIDTLIPHPSNPNRGDVDLITESITANGFYGAVLAQESTHHILAGEHRWRALKSLGVTHAPVLFADVDDDTALAILLVDNRSSEKSSRDDVLLADLLDKYRAMQGALTGTGYTDDDLDELLRRINTTDDYEDVDEDDDNPPIITIRVSQATLNRWHELVDLHSGDEVRAFERAVAAGLREAQTGSVRTNRNL